MSATNQIESQVSLSSAQGAFYSDQYVEIVANFVATLPAVVVDNFNSYVRFRKTGKRVDVEIAQNGTNAGINTNITRYDSLALIPLELRPSSSKSGTIMLSNTAATYNQAGFFTCNSNGTMYVYPSANAGVATFLAGSYIQNSSFSYYL